MSRVITSSPWRLTFNSCCLIGEGEQYWWLITWMFGGEEVAGSQGPGLGTANEGVVIPPRPTNSLLFFCQYSDSPLKKKKEKKKLLLIRLKPRDLLLPTMVKKCAVSRPRLTDPVPLSQICCFIPLLMIVRLYSEVNRLAEGWERQDVE